MTTVIQTQLTTWMRNRVGRYRYSQNMVERSNPVLSGATDCSALVRYCYALVAKVETGTWTGDQQRYGRPVFGTDQDNYQAALAALQPGDLVFFDWDGQGVASMDHVEMYLGGGQTIGHGGPGYGPTIKSLRQQWDWAHSISARRYVEGAPTTAPQLQAPPPPAAGRPTPPGLPQPFPLPRTHYFGLITGPDASHGGYYGWERPLVRIIQQRLIHKGYVPGITDWNSPWADGIFEQPTADAVARFQHAEMPGTQYFGQVWWDDYAQLAK